VRLLLLLSLCFPLAAQDRLWKASVATLGAAHASDVASSWGRGEANPVLRGGDGRFGVRGLVIKSLSAAAAIAPQWAMPPRYRSWMRWVNFGLAGVVIGVAARNYSIRSWRE
jgi:hypothetical protein